MTLLNQAQVEQLKEITTHLRQVRQEKSIRIEEIAAQTLIRAGVLHALEEERFEELPEAIFLQGFIRRYADALGLDGNALSHTLISNPVVRQDPKNDHKNSDNKPNTYIPLVVTYILLLVAASAGLLHILNPPQITSESLTPEVNNQQSIVSNTNKLTEK
ncbi:helix-turn-helix transcriptional regulator [Nostoc sp. FACHB-133]|uniref:helix-turn-helix domain-containing protein n=1 Tax=Nostoc sp. FACHB-133 TaxID=2692835 RepID=UPI001684A660|nr:helix-turn-helix domain-containing protein [Nostoc sp. FACHB-133]MBD2521882.1 helix-turn-helix domain-containing protein [Nostoc sp. FACHB-133]